MEISYKTTLRQLKPLIYLKGIDETIGRINSGESLQNLDVANNIRSLLENGKKGYEIISALNITPYIYKSYTNPKWYGEQLDKKKNREEKKEQKRLDSLKGIEETIEKVNSGEYRAINLETAIEIKGLLERGSNFHEIASACNITPYMLSKCTDPKCYGKQLVKARGSYTRNRKPRKSQVSMPCAGLTTIKPDQDDEAKRGIQATISRITYGDSRKSLDKAKEIQKYLLEGISPKEIPKRIGISAYNYREYVHPGVELCREKCFPSRRQEGINSARNHLEALSYWSKEEFETGAGLSLYELGLRQRPKKETDVPFHEYLDGLVLQGILNHACLDGEAYYSPDLNDSLVQKLIRIYDLNGSLTRLKKEQHGELKQERSWKRLCKVF